MSRCFPFPPPGYEKKLSSKQEDLLAKEKHKEKKPKKEKKNKERSESRDKHKEKKDKNEKHKDKKKVKDNDKIGTSSDRKNEPKKANEIKESKFTEELGRRIRDEEQGATNHMVEKYSNVAGRRTENNIASTSTAMGKDAYTNNKIVANVSVSMHRKNDVCIPPFHQKGTNGFEIPSTIIEKQKNGSAEKIQELASLEKRNDNYTPPFHHKRTEGIQTPSIEKQKIGSAEKIQELASLEKRNDNYSPPFHHKRTEGIQTPSIEKQKIGDSEKRLAQPTNGRHIPPVYYKKTEGIEKQKIEGSEKKLTPPPLQRSFENAQNKRAQINQKVGEFATEQRRNHVNIARPFDRSPGQKNESIHAVNSMQKATSNNLVSNSIGPSKKRSDEQLDWLVDNITTSVFESTGAAQATENEILFPNITSTEARDRSKEKKLEDAKKEGRHKDRDGNEKKRKDKDKDRHREKKKEEKNNSKSEQKHINHDKLRDTGIKDQIDSINGKIIANPTPSTTASGADGHNKKRKEFEMNGVLHEPQLDERPNKLPKSVTSSSHQLVNNGKPLQFDHIAMKSTSSNNIKVARGIENNGNSFDRKPKVDHQPLHIQKQPVAPITLDSKKSGGGVESGKKDRIKIKPPHPDTKYLDLICSVPQLEEIFVSDEQDWILRSKKHIEKKITANESPPKVWAQGLRIEEADIFALPYVVPF